MTDLPAPSPEVPPGLGGWDRAERVAALRQRLAQPRALLVPGAPVALVARIVERAGFEACYATGAGVANLEWGLADLGLLGAAEMAVQAGRLADATHLPLIVDADDGYGGPLGVMRTVRHLEAAGAAAVQLEDQAAPKRCGHFDGKRLIGADEMVAKLRAAKLAMTDDTVLVARTDAVAVEGLDAALRRAERYRRAGADVLFVEAPEDQTQLERIGAELGEIPLLANVVEGGRTPELDLADYERLGFRVVLYANLVLRVMLRAADDALGTLAREGHSRSLRDVMLSWTARQELVLRDAAGALEDWLNQSSEA